MEERLHNRRVILSIFVLLLFAAFGTARHLQVPGDDLAPSYCACRLLAADQGEHLFSRDAHNFDVVHDPVWLELGRERQLPTAVHPYVQSPLWAFSLRPLCTRMNYPAFRAGFLAVVSAALVATIGFAAWAWTRRLFHPAWLAVLCAALYGTEAYKYTMVLVQSHILFVLPALLAVFCASRGRSGWAGALLSVAAAVKITPGFLLFYWLGKRDWRASISFLAFSILLAALSLSVIALPVNLAYLHSLAQLSNALLVSWNNQSLAAWWMSSRFPSHEQGAWHLFPLPGQVKWACTLLSIAAALFGGFLDRSSDSRKPPYGAALAFLGITVFAPIAWTHYYVLLIFPLILLLDRALAAKSPVVLATVGLVLILNLDFEATGGLLKSFRLFPLARPEFLSGLITMAALAGIGVQTKMLQHAAGASTPTEQ